MRKNKGFTLIELLAVIIILGVLMLIAIPSVTQYISNSRKSTYLSSGSSYMNAVSIKVNNQGDQDGLPLTDPSKVYFIPVGNKADSSCVLLEKGGKTPFGDWWTAAGTPRPEDQGATKAYAYVIVVMNDAGTKYSYGFVAKDSRGYGFKPMMEGQQNWKKEWVDPAATPEMPADGALVDVKPNFTLPGDLWKGGAGNPQTALYYTVDSNGDCVPAV